MTSQQRDILNGLILDDNTDIRTIEYPSHVDGFGDTNLKVVYMVKIGLEKVVFVDFYSKDGQTVETRELS